MTKEERQQLREAARAAQNGTIDRLPVGRRMAWVANWKLQTSNSFRRIGTLYGDGDVLCATKHPCDAHPDLLAAPGVLNYVVAVQPRVVLKLLDDVDMLEEKLVDALSLGEAIMDLTGPEADARAYALVKQLVASLAGLRK